MPVSGGGSHYSWHLYGYGKYGEIEQDDSMDDEDEAYVRRHLFTLPKSSGDTESYENLYEKYEA